MQQEGEIYARTLGNVNDLEAAFSALWTQCQRCQANICTLLPRFATVPNNSPLFLAVNSVLALRTGLSHEPAILGVSSMAGYVKKGTSQN